MSGFAPVTAQAQVSLGSVELRLLLAFSMLWMRTTRVARRPLCRMSLRLIVRVRRRRRMSRFLDSCLFLLG
jgi:hypothetical protein